MDNAQVSAADLENVRLSAAGAAGHRLLFAGGAGHAAGGAAATRSKPTRRTCSSPSTASTAASRRRVDITLAQTQLAGAQAQSTDLHIARAQDEHAIAMLTGQAPASLEIGATQDRRRRRRPFRSRCSLAASRAASRYRGERAPGGRRQRQHRHCPDRLLSHADAFRQRRFSSTTNLANLFTYASRTWSAGPVALADPVRFRPPRSRSCESAQAAYDATVAAYRQTVLAAFQEVEDDLATLRYLAEEAVQQQEAVAAAQEALESRNRPL